MKMRRMWRRFVTIATVLAFALTALPAQADAFGYDARKIDPGLLQRVLADPKADYDVIVRSAIDTTKTKYDRDDRAKRAGDEIKRLGGAPRRPLGIVGGASAKIKGAALLALTNSKLIDYVFANSRVKAHWDPTIGAAAEAIPGLQSINVPNAWSTYGVSGQGVGVAVVDSGVAAHPDLGSRLVAAIDFTQPCATSPCPVPTVSTTALGDPGGHGTHVAGLIAGDGTSSGGAYTGVAPRASIIDVRVIDANGNSNTSMVLQGLEWILNNRSTYNIKVVNMSLGATPSSSYKQDPLDTAVEVLNFSGLTVVVAAGNCGPAASTITSPADDPFIITVGAVDDAGTAATADDSIATFSARGRTAYDALLKPDVSAPGRKMISLRSPGSTLDTLYPEREITAPGATTPQYFLMSGTSMAAPVVAGTVALMLERNSTLTPAMIKKRLKSSASPISGFSATDEGAGRIDVARTVGSISTDKEYSSGRVTDSFAKDMRNYIVGQPIQWRDLNYNGGLDSNNIPWSNVTWENITWDNITWENITWESFTWSNIT
ncbi:MAG: S8 family peptidase, partial [Chloroflexota bacterium]|nr:S8 family peptidase [Chloroflexota bacterium]